VVVVTSDYSGQTTKMLFKSGAEDVFSLAADSDDLLACLEAYVPNFKLARPKNNRPSRSLTEKAILAAVVPGGALAGAATASSLNRQSLPTIAKMEQTIDDGYKGLELSFFGTFTARFCGKPLTFTTQAKSLFAYLAYNHNRGLSRDHLAKVFWPDKHDISPDGARRSLNVELTHIRNAFRAQTGVDIPFLSFEKGCYRLQFQLPILSDVQRFKNLHQQIQDLRRQGQPVSEDRMQEAIYVYQGNFLDDFPTDTFNWVEVERQHLSSVFEQFAELFSEKFCDSGDFGKAAALCEEILTRDPRLEVVYRRGMICHANQGKPHKVKSLYDLYCKMMVQEFGALPSPDITTLYHELMRKFR
jgi:DNA-binding SARP family transcriptional activator